MLFLTALALLSHSADSTSAIGPYSIKFVENISFPTHPGYAQIISPSKMIVTSFEATPFIGKDAIYVVDANKRVSKYVASRNVPSYSPSVRAFCSHSQ